MTMYKCKLAFSPISSFLYPILARATIFGPFENLWSDVDKECSREDHHQRPRIIIFARERSMRKIDIAAADQRDLFPILRGVGERAVVAWAWAQRLRVSIRVSSYHFCGHHLGGLYILLFLENIVSSSRLWQGIQQILWKRCISINSS